MFTGGKLTKATGAENHEAVVGLELLATEPAATESGRGESGGADGPAGMEVLGDSAYGTGEARAALVAAGHTAVIKPGPLRPAVAGGFTVDDFTVDETAGTVSCPNGVVRGWRSAR